MSSRYAKMLYASQVISVLLISNGLILTESPLAGLNSPAGMDTISMLTVLPGMSSVTTGCDVGGFLSSPRAAGEQATNNIIATATTAPARPVRFLTCNV